MNKSGTTNYSGRHGISENANPITTRQTVKVVPHASQYAPNFDEIAFCDSLNSCLNNNCRFGGARADLSWLCRTIRFGF